MRDTINKGLLAYAVGTKMFCGCKTILDVDRAVHIDLLKGNESKYSLTVCAGCYDQGKDKLAKIAEAKGLTVEIIDGRELKGVRAAR